jgi:hypothetical protein
VLLVIGFVLTGFMGALLTHYWHTQEWEREQKAQSKEWERQQRRLLDIKKIDLKYQIINEITKAVGERNAATMQILGPLATKGFTLRQLTTEEEDPFKNWQKTTNEWRINYQILQIKIGTHIQNEEAVQILQRIRETQKTIFAEVTQLKSHLSEYYVEDKEPDQYTEDDREALKTLDGIRNAVKATEMDLKRLIAKIAEEAQADVERPAT